MPLNPQYRIISSVSIGYRMALFAVAKIQHGYLSLDWTQVMWHMSQSSSGHRPRELWSMGHVRSVQSRDKYPSCISATTSKAILYVIYIMECSIIQWYSTLCCIIEWYCMLWPRKRTTRTKKNEHNHDLMVF